MKQTGKSASKKVERNMKQIEDGYRRQLMIDRGGFSEEGKNKKK